MVGLGCLAVGCRHAVPVFALNDVYTCAITTFGVESVCLGNTCVQVCIGEYFALALCRDEKNSVHVLILGCLPAGHSCEWPEVNVPFSVARYAESSQALVSYWRIPGRRLRNFAWLHVEPRPVPELAWGGEFVDRAVCRSRPRRDVPNLLKSDGPFEALKRVALRWANNTETYWAGQYVFA